MAFEQPRKMGLANGNKSMDEISVVLRRFGDEQSTLLDQFERRSFEVQLNQAILSRSLSETSVVKRSHYSQFLAAPPTVPQVREGRGGSGFNRVLKMLLKPILGRKGNDGKRPVADSKIRMSWKAFSRRIHHNEIRHRKPLVIGKISVPYKNPSRAASSGRLISADRISRDLVKGGKPERLHFDGRTDRVWVVNFLDKIRAIPFKDTSEILSIMEKEAGNWTLSDFNGLLMALVAANESDLAMELYSNVTSCGSALAPNCWTFSIVIRCCCNKNDLDDAQRVLHHMIETGYAPNVITFTTLINSLCKRGKLQNAFEVFELMGRIGCKPTVQTYNCLLKGLCYVGRMEEAHEMLMNMKKESIRPDIYSYTAVMDGFCKVGRSEEAMELLNQALEMGLAPNVVTFNTLFTGYNKEGRPCRGFRVLKLMKERNCIPDRISYSTLLSGLLKWGKIRAALGVYKEMVSVGFEVDGRMMSSFLRGLCMKSWKEKDLVQDAYQVFGKMSRDSIISHSTYGFVIRTLCMGMKLEEALYHLQQMIRVGYIPRTITFNNVIQALCMEGKIREALVVLVTMYENGRIPSRTSYDILVKEFNQQGRLLGACNVYGAALKQGVIPQRKPLV